jgi:hypothetical protein
MLEHCPQNRVGHPLQLMREVAALIIVAALLWLVALIIVALIVAHFT